MDLPLELVGCFSGEAEAFRDLAVLIGDLEADLPRVGEAAGEAAGENAEGSCPDCPSCAELRFQGLSDSWKGLCLVGLRRVGDFDPVGAGGVGGGSPELPKACCS